MAPAADQRQQQASLSMRVFSALLYAGTSILVIYANKIVLTVYEFPSFLAVALGQMAAGIVILGGARALGLVAFPHFSWDIPGKLFPLPILYVLNLITGLGGTQKLNLPMFTVLRRFSIFMTMVLEYYILGVPASWAVRCAVGLMIAGALVAALNDLTFNTYGYLLILANDLCTASNGVYMKQKLDAKDLGKYGLLFYNALFMLPFAAALAYFTGDIDRALSYARWRSWPFAGLFAASCVCGFALNYAIVLCTQCNSALTTACVGPIKNLFVTYGGMLLMGDYVFSAVNFAGINISVLGSILYAYVTFGGGGRKPLSAGRTLSARPKARHSDTPVDSGGGSGAAKEDEKPLI